MKRSLNKQLKLEEYRRLHNPGKKAKEMRKAARVPMAHGEIVHASAKSYNRQKTKKEEKEWML